MDIDTVTRHLSDPLLLQQFTIILLFAIVIIQYRQREATVKPSDLTKLSEEFTQHQNRFLKLESLISHQQLQQQEAFTQLRENQIKTLAELQQKLQADSARFQTHFEQRQTDSVIQSNKSIQSGLKASQEQLSQNLSQNMENLAKQVESLTEKTDKRLMEIGGLVEKRLEEGFKKTTETFTDVLKRLALIDEAQKKITELSSDVVSLQEILADKRSRGAFGEVQLNGLVANVMPEKSYAIQYKLPNEKIADCALFLPEPTGTIIIDAKFPLESFKRSKNTDFAESERKDAEKQFKLDIKKHIRDISEKYILPGITSDGAVMFIPAEAIFAEIQSQHADLVEFAQKSRVWIVSPTTLWATLNTARAVLKDVETREQVDIIQEHLIYLAKDFERFQTRMDDLSKHIRQAHEDVDKVNTSARKISSRFEKIEKLEMDNINAVTVSIEKQDS